MALCKCPRCAGLFDLQVRDVKAWHAEKWPGYSPSQLAPEICPTCQRDEYRRRLASEPLNFAAAGV
jgi:hypothetical protein